MIYRNLKEDETFVGDGAVTLTCTVTEGVIVCVYDSVNHRGGALVLKAYGTEVDTEKERLKVVLRKFKSSGSLRENLDVKFVAGVNGKAGTLENIGVVKEVVKLFGLRVTKEAAPGKSPRDVKFDFKTGEIFFREKKSDSSKESLSTISPLKSLTNVENKVSLLEKAERRGPLRVLIVDDSKVIQKMIASVFKDDPEFTVVGTANHPGEADQILATTKVDVMTLDMKMPVMDGLAYLAKLMPERPMPVIMISGAGTHESDLALKALELGAVDFVEKPSADKLKEFAEEIKEKLKTAANARISVAKEKVSCEIVRPVRSATYSAGLDTSRMIVLGASTGGTVALSSLLPALPPSIPPILIVQHIPAGFSKLFADRLNTMCPFTVKEAENGEAITPGKVLIAPGGLQMYVKKKPDGTAHVVVKDDPPVNKHCPAVDVLFDSVVEQYGSEVLGVLLTGMGKDGAQGLLKLKNKGCFTIAQDEQSSAVFGMPREAIRLGGAEHILALSAMAEALVKELGNRGRSRLQKIG